jgi:DNA-binding NarL/FixJ family response regulator
MKLLLVAAGEKRPALEALLGTDFKLTFAADGPAALEALAAGGIEAVLVHLGLGEEPVLDLIVHARKRAPEEIPGVVVLAREADRRCIIELVRTGAYDVILEESMKPRELPHAVRNAAFDARSAAWLDRRQKERAKEVMVVGTGDAVDAIVLLLESAGLAVRQLERLPGPGEMKSLPRTLIVDLAKAGDGDALLKLLAPD